MLRYSAHLADCSAGLHASEIRKFETASRAVNKRQILPASPRAFTGSLPIALGGLAYQSLRAVSSKDMNVPIFGAQTLYCSIGCTSKSS
jgi:hypothetical protein